MNEIIERSSIPAVVEQRALTAADVRSHVNLIQQVMQAVMKEGTHYGTIPGCNQPSLYKAGSEVLLTTFRIAVDPIVEDLSTEDEIRYRVKCKGVHQLSGIVVGHGIGEASTSEDKYRWRKAVCDEEFNDTPPNRRRIKYARGKGGTHYTINQVRTEPADLANTVLKMAKKRAQIDLTLTATGASDIFTQDVEDLPDELRDGGGEERPSGQVKKPQAKRQAAPEQHAQQEPAPQPAAAPNAKLSEGQLRILRARMESAKVTDEQFTKQFGVVPPELPAVKFNEAAAWVREMTEAAQR